MNRTHARNVFWSGFEAAASGALSFASAFIVARLAGPAEVGIGAAAVAVHVLLWVLVNALFADPLVQRATIDDVAFSSAFWASITVAIAAAAIQAALSWPLAWSLGDTRLIAMSLALALALPLVGAAGPVQGLLTRDRAYKALAARTLIGQGLGTSVGIATAFAGAGAWALVLQQLVISLAGALALLARSPRHPQPVCHWPTMRAMLKIGLPLTISTMVQHGRYRLFALMIGATAGAAALGQVHMAFRLVDTVRELAFTAQWRLMLPVLSAHQDDIAAMRSDMDRCLAWSGLVTFPVCGAMAVSIEPLIALLLGPAWHESGYAALPLVGLTAWLFFAFPAGVAVVARGEVRYTLIANLAGTVATVLGVLMWRPNSPMQAVLVWLAAQLAVSPYILQTNARVLRVTLLRPLRAGVATMALTAVATLAAIILPRLIGEPGDPAALIALRVGFGAAIYLPGLALLLASGLTRQGLLSGAKL